MDPKYYIALFLLEQEKPKDLSKKGLSKTQQGAIGGALVGSGVGMWISKHILGDKSIKVQVQNIYKTLRKQGVDRMAARKGVKVFDVSAPILLSLLVIATLTALTAGVTAAVFWISEKLQKKGHTQTDATNAAEKMGTIMRRVLRTAKKIRRVR